MNKTTALALAAVVWASAGVLASRAFAEGGGKPQIGAWGVDLTGMDKAVRPGDDFFDYANGAWFKRTDIPADRTNIGSFQNLAIVSESRSRQIVQDLRSRDPKSLSGEQRKLRDLYDAFTDQKAIETRGLTPAQKDLKRIAALNTAADVARLMGDPALPGDGPFAAAVSVNQKNSNQYVMQLRQSGLGLPDRDFYLREDKDLQATREAYRVHLARTLTLLGFADAAPRADKVYDLEVNMARLQWTAAERRNADKTYNPTTLAQLLQSAPGFEWTAYFAALGVSPNGPSGPRTIVVRENTAFAPLAALFAATPVAVWRDYLAAHYVHNVAAYLPERFDAADFEFYGKALSGAPQQLPRDTRAVRLLDATLPHALGKIYVAKYFPPESKAKVEALVGNILKAYDADIRRIDWMTDATKARALEKLHAFTPHVGYPDKWRDYSALKISRDDLIGDIERSAQFEWSYRLTRLDQAVDRGEWNMSPPTVNAYYTPVFNSIFFPAAILQPPFFDPNADDAANYGGIGVVMGHEIGHGFDDQGSKYTGAGILESWWTDADRKAFETRVSALGAQFDAFEGLPGLHVNGRLTMGENIGDLSGLAIALQAYHISLRGAPAPVLDGFTGDQRYFLSFAQVWRGKYRDGQMRQQILSNPHSPPHFRVVGPTRNIDAWYAAFDVKPGDKLYVTPDQRVKIW